MRQDEEQELPIAFANPVNNDEVTHYDQHGETSQLSIMPAHSEPFEVSVITVECGDYGDYCHVIDEGTIIALNVVATDEIEMEGLLKKNEQLQKDEKELLSQLRAHLESPEILQSTRGELLISLIAKTKQLQQYQEQQKQILTDACDQRYRYNEILQMQGELRQRQNEAKYHLKTILWLQGKTSTRPTRRSLRLSHPDSPRRPQDQDSTIGQKIGGYCKMVFWCFVILMVAFAFANVILSIVLD